MSTATVDALRFHQPTQPLVDEAARVAAAVVDRLSAAERITLSFRGLRGLSSSYFNILLGTIGSQCGQPALTSRVCYEFDSKAQRMIFERSLASVLTPAT